ncbi:MAG: hypothetical protein GY899_05670 [Verrucomicrobiaceae bacterium]|nr:hypothetical protein [Verrucomicrobiaceae bacterium]
MELHEFFTGRVALILDVVVLIGLMYLIARHEADWELSHHLYGNPKALLVFIPQLLAYRACSHMDFYEIFAFFILLISILLCLRFLFYVTWPRTAIIMACFMPYMLFITAMIHRERDEQENLNTSLPKEQLLKSPGKKPLPVKGL